MMKKLILFLSFFPCANFMAQSQYTIAQTEKSNDPKVVENFITRYPNHQKTPEFRRKLARMSGTSSSHSNATTTSQTTTGKHRKTADELNHLFNGGSSNSSSVYVTVKNQSKCPIRVSFTGKTSQHLDVPASSTKRILINKGNYSISSMICGAKYQQTKNVTNDYQLILGNK